MENICRTEQSPKLADKQAIEDELNIDGGKHVLACLSKRNYFKWIIKQLSDMTDYDKKDYAHWG